MTRAQVRPITSVPRTKSRRSSCARDWPRPPRRDPQTRMVAQLLALAGPDSSVLATSSRPWASATFIGGRHSITLRLGSPDHVERAEAFASNLPDTQFSIYGHIVADACIDEWRLSAEPVNARDAPDAAPATDSCTAQQACSILRLSVLTIEDW